MDYQVTVSDEENAVLEAVALETHKEVNELVQELFQRSLMRFMRNFIEDVACLNTEDQLYLLSKMAAEKKAFTDTIAGGK